MGRQQHQSRRCRRGRQRCRRDGGARPRDKSISMMHVFSLALSSFRPLAPPSSPPASDQGSGATSQAGCETESPAARHANRRLLSLRPPRWSPSWMLVMTPPRSARTGHSTSTSWCHSKMPRPMHGAAALSDSDPWTGTPNTSGARIRQFRFGFFS